MLLMYFSIIMKNVDFVLSQNDKTTFLFTRHVSGGGEHSAKNWCVSAMGEIAFLLSLLFLLEQIDT